VNRMLEDGAKLIEALEQSGFPIIAAFWQYIEDTYWQLVIVSPIVEKEGPKSAYTRLAEVRDKLGNSVHFDFDDISVIGPSWSRFRDFRGEVGGALGRKDVPGENHDTEGFVFGQYYVYRWNSSQLSAA
jgi:hypothetical protein